VGVGVGPGRGPLADEIPLHPGHTRTIVIKTMVNKTLRLVAFAHREEISFMWSCLFASKL
jgi:hypothetical protein